MISQFAHLWRTYKCVCRDFDGESWKGLGFGITQPDRLALHILQSAIFYMEGRKPMAKIDGTLIDNHSSEIDKEDLPDLENILFMVDEVEKKIETWIGDLDFESKNETYPWTGETAFSVVLFLLRHSQYHLGEMNALLNEQLEGKADDYFANQLN